MVAVLPKQVHSMRTRDGVRLDADVYYPDADGPFPVLLMRQPYGRAIASTIVYAPPSWYAAHGYIVVIQDVRGRGSSEGDFRLFATEIEDGADAVRWAASLPKSTGVVGMYGFSYQGMTQLYAAIGLARDASNGARDITEDDTKDNARESTRDGAGDFARDGTGGDRVFSPEHSPLKTICPAMVGYDLYQDWAYEGGAFCLQTNWGWAVQLAAETARREGDAARYKQLYVAARGTMDVDPVSGRSPLLDQLAPNSFYHDWLNHSSPDASYWRHLSPHHLMQDNPVDMPMFHVGGWFDTYLRGTLRLYQKMAAHSQYCQTLAVGPWPHLPWGRHVGDLDFGSYANSRISSIDLKQICWFDSFLKSNQEETQTTRVTSEQLQLFLMGSGLEINQDWIYLPSWGTEQTTTYYLLSSGLVSVLGDEGGLVSEKEAISIESSILMEDPTTETGDNGLSRTYSLTFPASAPSILPTSLPPTIITYDTIIHDPWRPVPAFGGHATFPAGPKNRVILDERTDILTYTTGPFHQPAIIIGNITVELYCQCDAPSFDLCAVLSDVSPDGHVYGMTQGYQRVTSSPSTTDSLSKPFNVCITLQSTCLKIADKHALRLSISGACYPAYAMNSGAGHTPGQGNLVEAQVITIEIHSNKQYPSKLMLPIVNSD